jgi:hypothetical protein
MVRGVMKALVSASEQASASEQVSELEPALELEWASEQASVSASVWAGFRFR